MQCKHKTKYTQFELYVYLAKLKDNKQTKQNNTDKKNGSAAK